MIDNTDAATALLAVLVTALTQIGIPAVFIVAWWGERQAHQKTADAYMRDLRSLCKGRQAAVREGRQGAVRRTAPEAEPLEDKGSLTLQA